MKKKILGLLVMAFCSVYGALAVVPNTYANCNSSHFMNLPAWYDGLPGEDNKAGANGGFGGCSVKQPADEQQLKQYVWTIALNITSIVFGVAGYIAILFVIWGAIQYMTTQGEPAKAAGARKTIMNEIVGIVICALASTIAGAINSIVVRARDDGGGALAENFFPSIITTATTWAGIIAIICIIISGIYYVTSNGDPGKVAKAKNGLLYSVIGLVIAVLAAVIVNTVLGAL